jgi:hypothetical protein
MEGTKKFHHLMTIDASSGVPDQLRAQLQKAKSLLYDPCGFHLSNYIPETESMEYGACRFQLNGKRIIFRTSKITPTKTGQFVTIWKRNQQGITEPFDATDAFDFLIISAVHGNHFGQFIFPKKILYDKGILSGPDGKGKRGIRVYPTWDSVENKQAAKTQSWQTHYFVEIVNNNPSTLALAQRLLLPAKK